MKKITARILAFILVFAMAFPITTSLSPETYASAAAVALKATKKTVVLGSTYTITLKDSSNVSKKSFKSSNTKIATVNGKGVVTPVAVGTAKITCTTTLKTGATVTLTCTITVKKRTPATQIAFKNVVKDKINAHIIEAGSSYDFNMAMTPKNATDTCYFTITDPEIASVNSKGVVTAKKEGITTLEVRAGLNAAGAKKSTVMAKTYIYVTPKVVVTPSPTPTPTPAVAPKATGISMISSQELQVNFNTAIEKSSVIDKNGQLITGAITITPGNNAANYGTLSAKLSEDKKTVCIFATGEFNGNYVVTVFNKVLSADGQIMEAVSFQTDYKDTVGPEYIDSEITGNGYVCQINFNEAIDISGLQIISVNGTTNQTVKSRVSSVYSYTLSEDKKSLKIDLSACGEKVINVMVGMVGIKDTKGNASKQYQLNPIIRCDGTDKPVANIISAVRESKTIITATFDQAIQYGGLAIVDGIYLTGVIDSENPRIVHYTIPNTSTMLSGAKSVLFSGYRNYNMVNTTSNNRTMTVNFTLDTTPPKVVESNLKSEVVNGLTVYTLELLYDKNISVVSPSGNLSAMVNNVNADIYSTTMGYTATASNKKLTLTLSGSSFEAGYYTFTIPAGLVMDSLENSSIETRVTASQQVGSKSELPQPVSVMQDPTNLNKIIVKFPTKLDTESAQLVSNYRVNDSIIPKAAIITQQSNTGATVELVFASGAFATNGTYKMTISGVKGYNGTYGEIKLYNTVLSLTNNNCPEIISCKLTGSNIVQITLTKSVTGQGQFQIYTPSGLKNCETVNASGNVIYVILPEAVYSSAILKVISHSFVDSTNSKANLPEQFVAEKAY